MTPFLRPANTRHGLSVSTRIALPYLALGVGILALGFSALFVRWAAAPGPVMGFYRLSLALTLAGAAAVLGSDFMSQMTLGWGDMLAISSGIFYAGYFLATQRGRQYLDTLSYIWIVGVFSSLTLLVICLVLRLPLTGYPTQTYLAFIGAAVIPQLGGYLSVGYAQGHLPASVVSPTMIGQPVMTALLAIPLLGETLHGYQVLGGLVVLAGIYMVHRSRSQQKDAEKNGDI